MKMEIDRNNFAKLVTACECYYRLDEIVQDLSDGAGLSGEKVGLISCVVDVTRAFSIYADRDDGDENILFLKFKSILDADLSLEEKVDILLGIVSNPLECERDEESWRENL